MEDQLWDQLCARMTSGQDIERVTAEFNAFFQSAPEACLVGLEKATNPTRDERLRAYSLIVMKTPLYNVLKLPPEISGPICQRAVELILNLLKQELSPYMMDQIAALFMLIYEHNQDFAGTALQILTSDQVPPLFSLYCFSDESGPLVNGESSIILQLMPFLFTLVTTFCNVPGQFKRATAVLLAILDVEHPPLELAPLGQFYLQKLYNGAFMEPSEIDHCVYAIADFMDEGVIPFPEIMNVVKWIQEKCPEKLSALSGFADVIEKLPGELVQEMINFTVAAAAEKLRRWGEEAFSKDDLDFCKCALEQTGNAAYVMGLLEPLVKSDPAGKCVAIYLLGFMMRYCQEANAHTSIIYNILASGIKSGEMLERKSVCVVLIDLDEVSANMVSILGDLMNDLLNMLAANPGDPESISLTVRALDNMCTLCDSEMDEILEKVWALSQSVPVEAEFASDFIELVASVLEHTSELNDEILDAMIAWLERMMSVNDAFISAACLKVIGQLIEKEQSLVDVLLPPSSALVPALLADVNEQVINSVMFFLSKVADVTKGEAVKLIGPILEQIKSHVIIDSQGDCPPRTESALSALACYARYVADQDVYVYLATHIYELLGFHDRPYLQYWGAMAISKMRSPLMGAVPPMGDIFLRVCEILLGDYNYLDDVHGFFFAAWVLFKNSRGLNPELYKSKSMEIIQCWLSKTDAAGNIFTSPELSRCLDDVMEFIGRIFKSKEIDVNPICAALMGPFSEGNEMIKYTVLGVFIDAVEYNDVSGEIVTAICQCLAACASSVTMIDLQQNIAYFMSMLLTRWEQFVELGTGMYPIMQSWWEHGISKKSGYAEMLENVASFFLAYARINPASVTEEVLGAALEKFPPAIDVKETGSMLSALCHMIQAHGAAFSPALQLAVAMALSRLYTETDRSKSERRAVAADVWQAGKNVFKTLMANGEIASRVAAVCQRKRAKMALLTQVMSE